MCGIVGYSGETTLDITELKSMLLMAEDRGSDSTGVATPEQILKKAVKARHFIKRGDIPTSNTVIGHTRAKTTGAVCDKNSHPFQSGDMVGVHNGYINNFYTLRRDERTTTMEVDSEIIWHVLNKYGLKEGIPKLRGSFALAWLDGDKHLNLYRHTNPIYIGHKNDNIYFGSKSNYLEALGCRDVESLNEHERVTISGGTIIETEDLSDYKPKVKTYNHSHRRNNYSWCGTENDKKKSKKEEKGGTGIRSTHSPKFAPNDAYYVCIKDGPVLYYWFGDTTYTTVTIEPVYVGVDYEWKEQFNLDIVEQQVDLENQFPAVFQTKTIQNIIKTQNN